MQETSIKPDKITKPIQLLGAWLAGLFSIDSCFLFAAANMHPGSWESGALTIAAIINVPIFLLAVFLLQTKFRPELQEDSYYSTYLSKLTNEPVNISKIDAQYATLHQKINELEIFYTNINNKNDNIINSLVFLSIGINKHLEDKDQIAAKLSEIGVITYSIFGIQEPPTSRTVAISANLSIHFRNDILLFARSLGFEYYSFFDNIIEETSQDVLFGSYGDGEYRITEKIGI